MEDLKYDLKLYLTLFIQIEAIKNSSGFWYTWEVSWKKLEYLLRVAWIEGVKIKYDKKSIFWEMFVVSSVGGLNNQR